MTQAEQILDALRKGEKITPLDALERFGCMRLGARIYDLKKQGHAIECETFETPTGKHIARYFISGPQQLALFS